MWVGIEMLGQAAQHGNDASQPARGAQAAKEKTTTTTKCQYLPHPHPVSAVLLFGVVLLLFFAFCVYAVRCRTGCLHCLGGIRRMFRATCHSLCYPFQHPVTVAVHRRSSVGGR